MTFPTYRYIHDEPDSDLDQEDTLLRPVADRRAAQIRVSRFSWSPAQWLAAVFGLFLVVFGAVALLRVGFDSLTGDTANVWVFEHTALMGIIDLVIGVLFLSVAGSTLNSRNGLITLGMLSLAFGLVIAIEPTAMAELIGGDEGLGWLFAIIGGISVIGAFASPTVNVRRSSAATLVEAEEI